MASTAITIQNRTDVEILAKVTWGYSDVNSAVIQPNEDGQIGDEYVWYDVAVYNAATAGRLAYKTGVYGNSTLTFQGIPGQYWIG
jgi:hypothetical protein